MARRMTAEERELRAHLPQGHQAGFDRLYAELGQVEDCLLDVLPRPDDMDAAERADLIGRNAADQRGYWLSVFARLAKTTPRDRDEERAAP